MFKIKKASAKERDYCALCGKKTEYSKDTPIEKRVGYIVGGGQLCYECYKCYKGTYLKAEENYG